MKTVVFLISLYFIFLNWCINKFEIFRFFINPKNFKIPILNHIKTQFILISKNLSYTDFKLFFIPYHTTSTSFPYLNYKSCFYPLQSTTSHLNFFFNRKASSKLRIRRRSPKRLFLQPRPKHNLQRRHPKHGQWRKAVSLRIQWTLQC